MAHWIEPLLEGEGRKKCSMHRDRPAVARMVSERGTGEPPVPVRYYCQECLEGLEPGVRDHGPD